MLHLLADIVSESDMTLRHLSSARGKRLTVTPAVGQGDMALDIYLFPAAGGKHLIVTPAG